MTEKMFLKELGVKDLNEAYGLFVKLSKNEENTINIYDIFGEEEIENLKEANLIPDIEKIKADGVFNDDEIEELLMLGVL